MIPFKNLQSENLSSVLTFTRFLAGLAIALVVLSLIIFVVVVASGFAMHTFAVVFMLLPAAIGFFTLACLLAAVVALEDNYRKRTEHLLSEK